MKAYKFLVLLIGAVFVSCSSVKVISYDELKPAQVSFPPQVRNIAVVNNMPPVPQARQGVVTIGDLDGDGKLSAESLASSLADTRYFRQVMICDSALYASDSSEVRYQLDMNTVNELLQDLDADMLFSLDRVFIQTKRVELLYPDMPVAWPVLNVKMAPVLSLYIANKERPVQIITKTDSLQLDLNGLLNDNDIRQAVASAVASMLSRQLVPYWVSTERLYFDGGGVEMRDAGVYVRENDWKNALDIWQSLYDHSKSKKIKARTACNIALAYEMLGNLEDAQKWLDSAESSASEGSDEARVIQIYKVKLMERLKETPYLNMQMGRFGNKF